jgi:hypothetical protein
VKKDHTSSTRDLKRSLSALTMEDMLVRLYLWVMVSGVV